MEALQDASENIFSDVRYFLINSKCAQVEEQLKSNGAQQEKYLSTYITHVICDDADNPDYSEVKEVFDLTIVKSDWVTKCLLARTILPVEGFSPDLGLVFNSVHAVSLNLPLETAKRIRALIEYNGGNLLNELNADCTHVVAVEYDENAQRLDEMVSSSETFKFKVVTPDWFIDCIKEANVIDEVKYNPKYLVNLAKNSELVLAIETKKKEDAELEKKQREKEEEERRKAEAISTAADMEHKSFGSVKKIERFELRKSTDGYQFNDKQVNVIKLHAGDSSLASPKSQNSPRPHFKLEPPQPSQPQLRPESQKLPQTQQFLLTDEKNDPYAMSDNMDEFKKLSASSIQSQLENTIRLNQTNMSRQHLIPLSSLENSAVNVTTTEVKLAQNQAAEIGTAMNNQIISTSSNASSSVQAISVDNSQTNTTTPPKSKTLKRPRKLSSGVSPNSTASNQAPFQASHSPHQQPSQVQPSTNSSFSLNMDDIFESVLSNVNKDQNQGQSSPTTDQAPKSVSNEQQNAKNNGVVPIYATLIRPLETQSGVPMPLVSFDEDTSSQDNQSIRENSHLIQFDKCLLGCVFYIKSSEAYYTPECLTDWQQVIEKYGGRVADNYEQNKADVTHVLAPNRFSGIYKKALEDKKRTVTPHWLEDVLQNQKLRAPWLAYHFPSPYEMKDGPLTNHIISTHGFNRRERLMILTLIHLLNGKYSKCMMNACSFLICKNTEGLKVDKAKSWNINIVNGLWLMELYLGNTYALSKQINDRYSQFDTNHFGYDQSFVTDYLDQWKIPIKLPLERIKEENASQANTPQKQHKRSPLKRRNRSDTLSPTNENIKHNKKDAMSGLSWSRPRSSIPIVMFTGFTQNEMQQYTRDLSSLNGLMANQCSQATHLIVDKIDRTARLLKCISTCEYIVHIKWLIDSKAVGFFKNPEDYEVKNEKFEDHYSCCLKQSMQRAKESPLLAGLVFYLSPSVRPSYSDLEEIIKNAGGKVVADIFPYASYTEPFFDEKKTGLTCKYVMIGSQKDLSVLRPFHERKLPIYHEELVLSGVLCQQLNATKYKFHIDELDIN